jgi:hypothetical protein
MQFKGPLLQPINYKKSQDIKDCLA